MTDSEIIKALECCRDNERKRTSELCLECPAAHCDIAIDSDESDCVDAMLTQTIDLINRQRAEIERLKDKELSRPKNVPKLIKQIKAEAIKEFAERLKDAYVIPRYFHKRALVPVDKLFDNIDAFVKEMVGEG